MGPLHYVCDLSEAEVATARVFTTGGYMSAEGRAGFHGKPRLTDPNDVKNGDGSVPNGRSPENNPTKLGIAPTAMLDIEPPRIPSRRTRQRQLHLWITDREYVQLRELAASYDEPLSAILRRAVRSIIGASRDVARFVTHEKARKDKL